MKNRRSFIGTTAVVGAFIPFFSMGNEESPSAEKMNYAHFGAGGKGFSDIKMMMRSGHLNLIAVADVDEMQIVKFKEAYPDVKLYKDWRELLKEEGNKIDCACVSTPDHMHAPIAVSCMNIWVFMCMVRNRSRTPFMKRAAWRKLPKRRALLPSSVPS